MKQIIVLHNFWMKSEGFEVIFPDTKTYEEAADMASILCYDKTTQFNHCSYKIIEIVENKRNRKLSFKERITGKIK